MYKIFKELPDQVEVRGLIPSQINYKTQLKNSLSKTSKMTKGRIEKVTYLNDAGDKVVEVTIAYNDNTGDLQHPLSRVTTRCWYDDAGVNHGVLGFDKTVKTKKYDQWQTIKEGQRRRHNIVEGLFAMANELGKGVEASAQMISLASEIRAYETTGDTTIITTVTNNTIDTWLNEPYPLDTSITFRQVLVATLSLP